MKEADDGLIKRGWTTAEVGFCIQNFLCLVEMFFIGIGMSYAFHYTGEPLRLVLWFVAVTWSTCRPYPLHAMASPEWASDGIRERDKNVGPLCAFWHGKAMSTVKDVAHDTKMLAKVSGGRRPIQGCQ